MWQARISVVQWFLLYDMADPPAGMYTLAATPALDKPKPSLAAFRFPFVAYPDRSRLQIWGRTTAGAPGVVRVQQQVRGAWSTVARYTVKAGGIFDAVIARHGNGSLRATLAGASPSPAFSLAKFPDPLIGPFS
jgi:hypothetical protein